MNIIQNHKLATNYVNFLMQAASTPYKLGIFNSLDDILTQLDIDVIIEPGIIYRKIPTCLEAAVGYWRKLLDNTELSEDARKNLDEICKQREQWRDMPLRGLYEPKSKCIKLYPEEMAQEYGGNRMEELLVSTLAHEVMHAYFDRPDHSHFPYAIFVEEPLAEFGMLLYLNKTNSNHYDWAHADVSSKRTCYKYGADLMDQHLNGNTKLKKFLEDYKIAINAYTIPDFQNGVFHSSSVDLPSLISMVDSIPIFSLRDSDLVSILKDMLNQKAYYETVGNIYLLFGIIYANQIHGKKHAEYILIEADRTPGDRTPGQAQRIMDGVRLGKTLRKNNML